MNADDRAPAGPRQPPFAPVSAQPGRPGVAPQGAPAASVPQQGRPASPFGAVGAPQPGQGQPGPAQPTPGQPAAPQQQATQQPVGQQPTAQQPASAAPAPSGPQRTAFRPQPGTTGQQPVGAPQYAPAGAPQAAPAGGQPVTGTQRQSAFAGVGVAAGTQVAPAGAGTVPARSATGSVGLGKANRSGAVAEPGAPRKVRVLLSRLDPLSALKIGFLLSIAAGIMLVVAMHIIWNVVNSMGTLTMVNEWVDKLFEGARAVDLKQFWKYDKVMSATVMIAVFNTVILSAMSALGALIYNAIARVVGGVYLTLTDD